MCSAVNPSTLLLFARTLEERGEDLAVALETGALGVPDATFADALRRARLQGRCVRDETAAKRIRESMTANGGKARMRDAFPQLAGLVCWKGGSAPWYVEKLKDS